MTHGMWSRRVAPLIACAGLSLSGPVRGQAAPDTAAAAVAVARHQVTVDIGVLSAGIAYGHRLGTGPLTVGGGVWAAWEPASTIDPEFFQPVGVELFVRSQLSPNVQVEAGPSVLYYVWADDCGECGGLFVGLRGAAMVGHRFAYFGPSLRLGWAAAAEQPDGLGLVFALQVRLFFGWER